MKKSGFTLIELLVVIVIIGIFTTISVPLIRKYIDKNNEQYYDSLVSELISMTKSYFAVQADELPKGQIENNISVYNKTISLQKLEDSGYVTNDVVDTKGNSCNEKSYVIVSNESNNYSYQACLICNGKSYTPNVCNSDGSVVSGSKADVVCKFTGPFKDDYSTALYSIKKDSSSYYILKCGDRSVQKIENLQLDINKYLQNYTIINVLKSVDSSNNHDGYLYKIKAVGSSLTGDGNLILKAGTMRNSIGNENGKIISDKIYVDNEKPNITIVSAVSTLPTEKEAALNITAKITDNFKVVAYTDPTKIPITSDSTWKETSKQLKTIEINLTKIEEEGTYYIGAKDDAGNISSKKIIVTLSDWSKDKEEICNKDNTILCKYRETFKKEERTVTSTDNCYPYSYGCQVSERCVYWGTCYSGWDCTSYSNHSFDNSSECSSMCDGDFDTNTTYYTQCSFASATKNCRYKRCDRSSWGCCRAYESYEHDCLTGYNTCATKFTDTITTYTDECTNVNSIYYGTPWTTLCTKITYYQTREFNYSE